MSISTAATGLMGTLTFVGMVSLAQEARPEQAMQPEREVRRVVVKHYSRLSARAVWRAADAGSRADVRFSDIFEGAASPRGSLRTVRLAGRLYEVGAVFGTQGDLTCLVPADQVDTLGKLRLVRRGQEITVEGTIVGSIGTRRAVLVDRVLTGQEDESVIQHELILGWPGYPGAAPKRITQPGEHQVQFSCRYARDKEELISLLIEQVPRRAWEAELARQKAAEQTTEEEAEEGEEEGEQEPPEKRYDLYRPEAVYRHAGAGNPLNVRFQEIVKGTVRGIGPVLRPPGLAPIRVGYAFETYVGLTCVVPAEEEETLGLARNIVPGQELTIEGTILPPMGAYKMILVDSIEGTGLKRQEQSPYVWVVTVFWGEEEPKVFYQVGSYLLDFPCRYAEGRREVLNAELREVRVIKVSEE